ncbi:RE1-silencing transcription factor-like isoform X1 [Labrus mixtus]|uniref:RE1-silencing transcription factor-like isoform X1 n=1 Tax=Labrus mixtus TaxID=508554 RepID=UPI0029C07EEB|nr:RE1-silencing transcription factor-like isoform X1 [Labrus mixtus]
MCSVVGCYSGRLGVQRFKLPEDPERRLEWVRFLATVNKQRFKESSWTDISVCIEHFKDDCFENKLGVTDKVQLTLKPSAVPSLFDKSESEEPEPSVESPTCGESLETIEGACQRDDDKSCDSSSSSSEGSGVNPIAFQGSQFPRKASSSPDKPSIPGQVQPRNVNINLMREKAARLQMKGKFVVNEKHLLQLLNPKCPSCGCKLKTEKVTNGLLIIFNQQCLQCGHRNQWTSQVDAKIPTDEEQHLTGCVEVTPESPQVEPTDDAQAGMTDVPEIVASIDEESDQMEETDESDQDDVDSDEDWKPDKDSLLAKVPLQKTRGEDETEDEDEDEEEEEEGEDDHPPIAHKDSQLCTDCGKFFNKCRPHTCEHKTKPYSCNICGKRFAFDHALSRHSRIHDANYEYRCKYCHVTFKTKVDKITHEQTHMVEGKPYKCPDCPETFAKNKERRIHIQDHRGPPQLKCDFCGIEFCWPLALRRHLAVHTGEKPHKCSICERGFNQQSHLKSHMRLHTGERPFKCQHCDKCFNHNVSLKSHVQRYHTFNLGGEPDNNNETSRTAFDFQGDQNNRVAATVPGNVEVKQEPEESVGMEQLSRPKYKKRSTGRPLGRPKSDEPNTKTPKRLQSLRKTQCTEESDDEQSDCDMSSDPAEDEEKRNDKIKQNIARSRGRVKRSNSKKKYSCQNTGKSLKRRGRPRKNRELCS